MIKKLLKGAKGYAVPSIMTVVLVMLETALEVVLPLFMSNILNTMQLYATGGGMLSADILYLNFSTGNIDTLASGAQIVVQSQALLNIVYTYGILMVVSAILSLTFGALAGHLCAVAGAGFSKNMRGFLFEKIQSFSFANVDKFSTASLVTRCTTDVNYAQQSFMMIIRTVVRAPAMLIFSTIMAFINQPDMAWVFLVAIPALGIVMALLATRVHPLFKAMF